MASLIPYLCVHDTRAAIRWYHDAFGATVVGNPIEMSDGTIGSAELALFGSRVVLSDPSPEAWAVAADPARPSSVKLHLTVPDCDACVARCRRVGAVIEREPTDSRYGRGAAILDPFGHRWMIVESVAAAAAAAVAEPADASAPRSGQPAPDRQFARPRDGLGDRPRDGRDRESVPEGAGWRAAAPMPTPYPLPDTPAPQRAADDQRRESEVEPQRPVRAPRPAHT